MDARHQICEKAIEQVAHFYARRWRSIGVDDLIQQGWAVALEILETQTLDEQCGGYIRNALSRSLYRYCLTQSAAVSGYSREPGAQLARVTSTEHLDNTMGDPNEDLETATLAAEANALIAVMRDELRWRLHHLHARFSRKQLPENEIAVGVSVLMDGEWPKHAATRTGIPQPKVYRITQRLKGYALDDYRTKFLLHNIHQARTDLCQLST